MNCRLVLLDLYFSSTRAYVLLDSVCTVLSEKQNKTKNWNGVLYIKVCRRKQNNWFSMTE